VDKDTVPLSRKWLNSVFWLFLGIVFGLLAGCSTVGLDAALTSEDVSICVISPSGSQCYKVKGSPPKTEDTDTLE
jgi:hypothetical protein